VPRNQIWYCADHGFGFAGEDDGGLRWVQGLNLVRDAGLLGPCIWAGKSDGPFWSDAADEFEATGKVFRERDDRVEQMRDQLLELERKEREEVDMMRRERDARALKAWEVAFKMELEEQRGRDAVVQAKEKEAERLRMMQEARGKAKAKWRTHKTTATRSKADVTKQDFSFKPSESISGATEVKFGTAEEAQPGFAGADFSKDKSGSASAPTEETHKSSTETTYDIPASNFTATMPDFGATKLPLFGSMEMPDLGREM